LIKEGGKNWAKALTGKFDDNGATQGKEKPY